MSAIYHGSSCNIASHLSLNDNDGFLAHRAKKAPSPKTTGQHSQLNTRGWVFQEMILAQRIIHLVGPGIAFFEDASGISTDKLRGVYPAPYQDKTPPRMISPLQGEKLIMEDIISTPTKWCKIVERYTRLQLTYETDRLPAIAGLASRFRELLEGRVGHYTFGLWSSILHQGLLWVEVGPNPSELKYNATMPAPPTWSWGRRSGEISYPDHPADCDALFDTISIPRQSYLEENATGSASQDGVLTLNIHLEHQATLYATRAPPELYRQILPANWRLYSFTTGTRGYRTWCTIDGEQCGR